MAKIKNIIFDLDGVLVDATEWHYEALNKALGLFGYEITREEHLSSYNGLPTRKKLAMLTSQKNMPESLHSFIYKMKQEYTTEYIERCCKPHFDKLMMLHQLKKKGYRLAVCSNAIKASVELMLQKGETMPYFQLVLSNQHVENPKPHPEIYLKAFEMMKILPEETVIVEDSAHGIASAKASGAHVCEVSGFRDVNINCLIRFITLVEEKKEV